MASDKSIWLARKYKKRRNRKERKMRSQTLNFFDTLNKHKKRDEKNLSRNYFIENFFSSTFLDPFSLADDRLT